MSEPAWLIIYTGAVTGVIGAITGIAGAIMGYVSYRRSQALKALDLRLELRKAENDLRVEIEDLPSLLQNAKKSHSAVASATGRLGSGEFDQWLADWESDFSAVHALSATIPHAAESYAALNHTVLEDKLIAVHATHGAAMRFRDKYRTVLAGDDKQREHIRADVRMRTAGQNRREAVKQGPR